MKTTTQHILTLAERMFGVVLPGAWLNHRILAPIPATAYPCRMLSDSARGLGDTPAGRFAQENHVFSSKSRRIG